MGGGGGGGGEEGSPMKMAEPECFTLDLHIYKIFYMSVQNTFSDTAPPKNFYTSTFFAWKIFHENEKWIKMLKVYGIVFFHWHPFPKSVLSEFIGTNPNTKDKDLWNLFYIKGGKKSHLKGSGTGGSSVKCQIHNANCQHFRNATVKNS